MDAQITAALIVGASIIFVGLRLSRNVEDAARKISEAAFQGSAAQAPHETRNVADAIYSLGRDVSAIRRKFRGEPDPQTLEEWAAEMQEALKAKPDRDG